MKLSSVAVQVKATEQVFLLVLFIMPYNFEPFNEIILLFESCFFLCLKVLSMAIFNNCGH